MDARVAGDKPSGIGMYIYNVVKELHTYADIEFALVTDVSLSDEMKELKSLGIKTYELHEKTAESLGIFKYFKFVQKCIYDYQPDIFWEGNAIVPIKIKNPYGKKIVSIFDVFPVSDPEQFYRLYRIYFRYGLHVTLHQFDYLVYDSLNAKKETEKYFKKAKQKESFVGYVIIPKLPTMDISDNGDYLYVGNLEKRKGSDILIEAYKKYRERGGTRGLRLAGKIQEDDIQEMIDSKIEGIQYLGYVTNQEKIQELSSCHAFVFPSRAEGFGIPVIEAMNYNKAIIASDLDTLKEVSENSLSFFHLSTDKEETIENLTKKLLEDDMLVDSKKYQEVIQKYTPEVTGKRFHKMLEELIK